MEEKLKVVLATSNKGKIRELADGLGSMGVEVIGMDCFPELGDIVEDGETFFDNALIKARTVAAHTGLISIADDSGLEVDALGGRPGVFSARYSEDLEFLEGETKDGRNNRKLLAELADVPTDKRTARFVCCMVAVDPKGTEPLMVRGAWDGRILTEREGDNGFGYDPVFCDPELGFSAAKLSRDEKNARSHRGKALRQLMAGWQDWLAKVQAR